MIAKFLLCLGCGLVLIGESLYFVIDPEIVTKGSMFGALVALGTSISSLGILFVWMSVRINALKTS